MASKRTKYIMSVFTIGSLVWSAVTMPDMLTKAHGGMLHPESDADDSDDDSPNDFDSVPDVESLLDLARSGDADKDTTAITLFEAQSTMSHEEQQEALVAQRHKRSKHH